MKRFFISSLCVTALTSLASLTFAEEEQEKTKVVGGHVFAWPFIEAAEMQPRGGTTKGSKVTLAKEVSPAWKHLQEEGVTKLERDRRAILAMAGDYRVSFDFTEILGFSENYEPPKPYFSWATEKVMVLEEREKFISLQHTLVMFFKGKDGKVSEPMVMKHWRQDWTYEDPESHVYRGHNSWERKRDELALKGFWSQAVYQVDDSPRYEAQGFWSHQGEMSTWSGWEWRPLPRREFSVRDDYNVLAGTNEVTITPTGWVHVQNNTKIALSEAGEKKYIGQELGVNRYERITAPSLEAAVESWEKVGPYWAEVRKAWTEVYQKNDRFSLHSKVDGKKLYQYHFSYAMKVEKEGYDPAAGKKHAKETIEKFISQSGSFSPKY